MKKSLLLVLLISNFFGYAQYTLIPDVNFEKYLVNSGTDIGPIDGKVLTASVSGIISLGIPGINITNLTGIQDFASLTYLDCRNNQLASLDVSKNTKLSVLDCSSNQLVSLNLKNGNNINFYVTPYNSNFTNNPNLTCIQVDNKAYSDANWSSKKDATASFSENCSKTASNVAPIVTASGNQIYCPQTNQKIVTAFDIVDPDDTSSEFIYVQISSGYVNGQDLLTLANPALHPTIKTVWDATAGKLTLSSPTTGTAVSYVDLIAAIKDIEFSNLSVSPSGIRNFSISLGTGQLSYLPRNGHYYEYVPALGINWTAAKDAAAARTYYGLQGYLATLTAADEAQLAGAQAPGTGWIGGSDAETEGTWKWVTGPEAGTTFWIGNTNGTTTAPFFYANWNSPKEPNNSTNSTKPNGEDYAHITAPAVGNPGTWNDLSEVGDPITVYNYYPKGYIVEYGGMPGDQILQISASTKITIPKITGTTTGATCGSGIFTLVATSTTGDVNWYDLPTGGTLLHKGNTFTTPNLTTTTTYYVDAFNGNCPNGPRTEIIATVKTLPSVPQIDAASTSPVLYCLNDTAIPLAATASANCTLNWYPSKIGGTSSTTSPTPSTASIGTTSYYVSQTIKGTNCEGSRAEIIVTVNPLPTAPTNVNNISYCNSETAVPLTATASTNCTLNWYPPTGGISSTTSPTPSTASVGTTRYYVSQTITATGCEGPKAEIIVTVYPIIKTNEEVLLCQSETVTLDASIPGMSYLWSPNGETSQTIVVPNIGDYSVTISSPFANCDSKKNFKVIEHPEPKIKEIVVNENSITIELSNPENYYEFSIDGELFTVSNQFSRIPSGQYTAFVREKNGCNLIEQDFSIFSIAKYFTPNNDGFNDVWEIKEMKNYPNSRVAIFNRYGKLLKQLNYRSSGWNGTFNGLELPADDYWYVLKMEDSQTEIKGHFSLKR